MPALRDDSGGAVTQRSVRFMCGECWYRFSKDVPSKPLAQQRCADIWCPNCGEKDHILVRDIVRLAELAR